MAYRFVLTFREGGHRSGNPRHVFLDFLDMCGKGESSRAESWPTCSHVLLRHPAPFYSMAFPL